MHKPKNETNERTKEIICSSKQTKIETKIIAFASFRVIEKVPKTLTFKTELSANAFVKKTSFIIKIHSKGFSSLENEARGNLGTGLLHTHSDGIFGLDQFRFLGNCPRTPPLSHHFAQSEK